MNGQKKLKLTWDNLRKQYNGKGTRITDDHLTEHAKAELEAHHLKLWGIHHKLKEGCGAEEEVADLVNQFYDTITLMNKVMEFTELFRDMLLQEDHQIPIKQEKYNYIDLNQLFGGQQ